MEVTEGREVYLHYKQKESHEFTEILKLLKEKKKVGVDAQWSLQGERNTGTPVFPEETLQSLLLKVDWK